MPQRSPLVMKQEEAVAAAEGAAEAAAVLLAVEEGAAAAAANSAQVRSTELLVSWQLREVWSGLVPLFGCCRPFWIRISFCYRLGRCCCCCYCYCCCYCCLGHCFADCCPAVPGFVDHCFVVRRFVVVVRNFAGHHFVGHRFAGLYLDFHHSGRRCFLRFEIVVFLVHYYPVQIVDLSSDLDLASQRFDLDQIDRSFDPCCRRNFASSPCLSSDLVPAD